MYAKERIRHVIEIFPFVPYNLNESQMKILRNIFNIHMLILIYTHINKYALS